MTGDWGYYVENSILRTFVGMGVIIFGVLSPHPFFGYLLHPLLAQTSGRQEPEKVEHLQAKMQKYLTHTFYDMILRIGIAKFDKNTT